MRQNHNPEAYSKSRRKEIFRALVNAQDHQISVLQSRAISRRPGSIRRGALFALIPGQESSPFRRLSLSFHHSTTTTSTAASATTTAILSFFRGMV
jgi:hypothetical protein